MSVSGSGFIICAFLSVSAYGAPLSLGDALSLAADANPGLKAARKQQEQTRALVGARGFLNNPRVGVMQERGMYQATQGENMGAMQSFTIAQEVLFPSKYILLAEAQQAQANRSREDTAALALELRQKVATAYVNIYTSRRVLQLLDAQRETLREIARAVESRRATGAVPQQDEMKAHTEQTKIENEIILQNLDVQEAEATLRALLDKDPEAPLLLGENFQVPELKIEGPVLQALAKENSRAIGSRRYELEGMSKMFTLAKWGYAPDFMVSFRKPFQGATIGAYSLEVALTIPLWFFLRERNELRAASAGRSAAEFSLAASSREVEAEVKALHMRAESTRKVLRVYETSLIPQATSTLNSSQAAYRAGRVGFQELLDSERSLYEAKIASLRVLAKYVASVAELERVVGVSLSTLPFGEPL